MKKLLLALAFSFVSLPAWAQCTGVFSPSTFCGNNSASVGAPPTQVPYSAFTFAPSSLALSATDPNPGNNTNLLDQILSQVTYTGAKVNVGFSDQNAMDIELTTNNGDNYNGGLTNNKTTAVGLNVNTDLNGGGQKSSIGTRTTCYGNGDCSVGQDFVTFAGGQINGDEGKGFKLQNFLSQFQFLFEDTITSVPTVTSCNTTTTQSITGSAIAQTITVASSTNCHAGDWVVFGQQTYNPGGPNVEAVKLTAAGSGTLTGAIRNNYNTATTVTPALILGISTGIDGYGQFRNVVNLTHSAHTSGTVASNGGNTFVGSGASFANNMVGGSSTNIGCVYFSADTYSDGPFNGSGLNGPLRSWYPIQTVTDSEHISVAIWDTASNTNYNGKQGSQAAYQVSPCAMILWTDPVDNLLILESTSTVWHVGDSIEIPEYADPDVNGFYYNVQTYSPGGRYRSFMDIDNEGGRTFNNALYIHGNMVTGPSSDTDAWGTAIQIGNAGSIGTGIDMQGLTGQAIHIEVSGDPGAINWPNAFIESNSTSEGVELGIANSTQLQGASLVGGSNADLMELKSYGGKAPTFEIDPQAFGNLYTCGTSFAGAMASLSDGTTNTLGAIVAGGGSFPVLAYCNGSNWVVMAAQTSNMINITGSISAAIISATSGFVLPKVVIASLPTCNAGTDGLVYEVTNGASPAIYNAIVSTTSNGHVPVQCNGGTWTYH